MQNLKIKTQNLIKLIEALKKKATVLAPQADEYKDVYLKAVSDPSKVILKHFKPLMPAVREALFGQVENMINFKKSKGNTKLSTVDESQETVLFGIPACDVAGIQYNDVFFGQREFADFYYTKAREKLTIISLACVTPPNDNCFCATMGHGPIAEEGFDLQLTDLGDGAFLVNVGSKKGEKIVADNKALFEDATDADSKKFEEIKKKAEKLPVGKNINKDKALGNMGREALNEKMMLEITDRCISCGACNYTCPTCTCFNVVDHQKAGEGMRKRILDSCILGGYFRMAGGHNPKGKRDERTRNRYFCKLEWDKEKFGDSGCVGCGRCLDACPVKIDIKEVMASLA
ncbi:MAG: 4Fe-4S dicluster domain-containing protein [Candidatus Margulisbacteria bacterium]|nr:4Fe-4S dicluster domain-containing protein [Candidatus Margulisiibacteriota bacterium]